MSCGCAERVELVLAEVRQLRAALERRGLISAPASLSLVPELARCYGERPFTARQAASDARLSAALEQVLIESPRELGICLARLEGFEVGGLVVRRAAESRDDAVWRVFTTQESRGASSRP